MSSRPASSGETSTFPPVFQYSQNNLQDYVECARRFQLRHVRRQPWPSPLAEPLRDAEIDAQRGEQFHRLIERHFLEMKVVPPVGLLNDWWRSFVKQPPPQLPAAPNAILTPEALYSVPFSGRRLVAKFDLLAIVPGERIVIVDWKTAHRKPSRKTLGERLQTAVYRYVAVEALAAEFGGTVPPDAVQLVYWFTAAPDQPEVFDYDAVQHAEIGAYLHHLIAEIEARPNLPDSIWPLTDDLRHCEHCNFRSLCARGSTAAPVSDELDDFEALSPDTLLEIEL
jgi:hypothetical protein